MVISPAPLMTVLPVALPMLMLSDFTVTPSTIVVGALTATERLYTSPVALSTRDTEPDTSIFVEV
jgi:hypothetical protein